MKLVIAGLALVTAVVGVATPKPFIQRIEPVKFLTFEAANHSELSRECDLVIYQESYDRTYHGIAIKRGGEIYSLIRMEWDEDDMRWSKVQLEIPPAIADQIMEVFLILLERQVLAPPARNNALKSTRGTDEWIFFRTKDSQVIAGVALSDSLHSNHSEEALAYLHIFGRLNALFDEPSEREVNLTELDRETAIFSRNRRVPKG